MCVYHTTGILYVEVLMWVNHICKPRMVEMIKSWNSKAKNSLMGDSY